MLRALRAEGVAQAVLARVGVAARTDGSPLLDHPRRLLATAAERVERLITSVATAERSAAEYRARRLTTSLCDLVQGALLVEEAGWELRERASARKAVIAGLFIARYLTDDPDAAAAVEEHACTTLFAPLLRYETIEPVAAGTAPRIDPHA